MPCHALDRSCEYGHALPLSHFPPREYWKQTPELGCKRLLDGEEDRSGLMCLYLHSAPREHLPLAKSRHASLGRLFGWPFESLLLPFDPDLLPCFCWPGDFDPLAEPLPFRVGDRPLSCEELLGADFAGEGGRLDPEAFFLSALRPGDLLEERAGAAVCEYAHLAPFSHLPWAKNLQGTSFVFLDCPFFCAGAASVSAGAALRSLMPMVL